MTDSSWARFCRHLYRHPSLDLTLDISRMAFDAGYLASTEPAAQHAFEAMAELEAGGIANPDENRQVGHYWLRKPELAPDAATGDAIRNALADVKTFSQAVHQGTLASPSGKPFTDFLLVGIGGSALGPQLTADALGGAGDKLRPHFLDNTDPDGMARVLDGLRGRLDQTLAVVISKSGGTKETRNGMLEAIEAFRKAGLAYAPHFVAVTSEGSLLGKTAAAEGWLHRFPMWDWVGGRTSVMSTVGLVPMALQGLDIDGFLAGAAEMDEATRSRDTLKNPAMLLALMWYHAGGGRGARDMVLLPYKDRLVLFSKYLQQLVMESLGKEKDLAGQTVHQGLAVYGNKGSTDQHAYVQQLRDGINNFFATFIEVRRATAAAPLEVEPGITSGDYLQGFLRGTRTALTENGRESITLSIPGVNARTLGALIALYERAVGFYAMLVHINAYHQPGVEAGKKAAGRLLDLQGKVLDFLRSQTKIEFTAPNTAAALGCDPEDAYHVLVHLAANDTAILHLHGRSPDTDRFCALA